MKPNLSFLAVVVLVFGFSALTLAQQPTTTNTKAPAKTEPKTMMEHKDKMAPQKLNKDEIIALQNALLKGGFYKGTANGALDTATKQALRDYQKANQLKVTGEPSKEVLNKLGIVYTEHHAKTPEHSAMKKSEPAKNNQP